MSPFTNHRFQKSYVICAVQRSGSFLLCESLKPTGLAGVPEEYFLNDGPWEDGAWARQHGLSNRTDYLRLVFEKGLTPNGTFGVKLIRTKQAQNSTD